ncbi:polysaccharide biosynthesis tyrosine autokinase [Demequina iriomotensis]|uniref:polysaccharide biosynthesis tyrosine autokinase n=1 Tax=Demequina iriomotensis TaxID=1536641 RepID=UPI0007834CFF|nr:polysaccharide biosynthesis tyrosine autokinase [Demequina iriomotensis]
MELGDYIRILRKNWVVIVALTALGGLVGLSYGMLATPTYGASATVFVSTADSESVGELAQGNSFTQQRVKTYADLVKTSAVLQPVLSELALSWPVARARLQVSATAPLDTTVIDVTAHDADPVFAASLATATANQLIATVQEIETTNIEAGSPVRLTVVQEAEVPQHPESPKKSLNVALGLVVGAALGVGIALIRAALDTRVRNERDLERITDAPVLGGIAYDPHARQRPLIVHEDALSIRAESFRTLRTNLQFLDADRPEKRFVLTSSVPSEGKSTTAANLAITLADAGARVLLVGADLRRPKIASYMGIEDAVGLTDVLIGRVDLTSAVQRWGHSELYLLPAGSIPPNPSELLGSSLMERLVDRLDADYDYVLYDAPPLLPVTDAAVLARLVGSTVLVVASGKTHSHQVDSAIASLETVGAPLSGLVLTMLATKGPDAYGYGRYGYRYDSNERSERARR